MNMEHINEIINIILQDIEGNSIVINTYPNTSYLLLKRHISNILKIPIKSISIRYNGKLLNKESNCIFKNNDVLHITTKLIGGFPVTMAGGMLVTMDPGNMAVGISGNMLEQVNETKNFIQRIVEKVMTAMKYGKDDIRRMNNNIQHKIERLADLTKWIATFTKTASMMARFYPIIVVALIILAFFGKPLEYIMLFIAALIVSILWVFVYILGLPVVRVIPYIPYNIVFYLAPYLLYTIIILSIFLVVSLFCLVLAAINKISGNKLQSMILCQNSPESWFELPNYHLDNIYRRSFFCVKPCASRYEPDGDSCKKMYKYQPAYCPPAEIMRVYTGLNRNDRVTHFKEFNQYDVRYLMKSPQDREKMLRDHYLKQVRHLDKCEEPMKPYKDITLNICANLDYMEKNKQLSQEQINKMRAVCYQGYCNSNTNYPFCAKKAASSDADMTQLIKQLCKILAIVIIFVILIIFILTTMYAKDK